MEITLSSPRRMRRKATKRASFFPQSHSLSEPCDLVFLKLSTSDSAMVTSKCIRLNSIKPRCRRARLLFGLLPTNLGYGAMSRKARRRRYISQRAFPWKKADDTLTCTQATLVAGDDAAGMSGYPSCGYDFSSGNKRMYRCHISSRLESSCARLRRCGCESDGRSTNQKKFVTHACDSLRWNPKTRSSEREPQPAFRSSASRSTSQATLVAGNDAAGMSGSCEAPSESVRHERSVRMDGRASFY